MIVYTSRRLTSILIFALLIQTFAPLVPSVKAEASSPSSPHAVDTAPRVDGFGADHSLLGSESEPELGKEPYLPVLYKTDTHVIVASSPTNTTGVSGIAASQTITNGEDIVYLGNSKQIGRTRDFSSISPNGPTWTPVTGTLNCTLVITEILDLVLDPNDPYHVAWAVGDTGIWRTTNLNDDPPCWTQKRSMNDIFSELGGPFPSKTRGVGRIVSDASRPGYFLVLLASEAETNKSTWIGWTVNDGLSWSWKPLPTGLGVYQGGISSISLAMSQDGSGQVWVGATDGVGTGQTNYILYSKNYGQSWEIAWSKKLVSPQVNPYSLYYSQGALFATVGISVGKSLDAGKTWAWAAGAVPPSPNQPYGLGGIPQTSQLVYYIATTNALHYSLDGGSHFVTMTQNIFTSTPSGVVSWLDNPTRLAWARGGSGANASDLILQSSSQAGFPGTWINKTGNWYTTFSRWVGRSGVYGNVFILVPSQVAHLRDLAKRGKLGDCALGCDATHWANDPIDTSSGNLSYQVTDLSVASLGGNLSFQRSYASAGNAISSTLGYGWVSNSDTHLLAPITLTHPLTVALQTSNGSQLQFFRVLSDTTTGTYAPDLGVTAALTRNIAGSVVTYTLVDKNQTTYTFNLSGTLLSKRDALNHLTTYSYTLPSALTQVTDVETGRWLKFTYDQGQMKTVFDNSGRTITFTYSNGDLVNLIDTRGLTWTYVYTGSHLLWKVIDPDQRTVIRTEYDAQGRAIEQYDGLGTRTVRLDFGTDDKTVLTNARGITSTDTYVRGTWTGGLDANSQPITRSYDLNFRPTTIADANGNATQMKWSPNGHNLEKVTYAPGVSITQKFDAQNNLTRTIDARGYATVFTYTGSFLTRKTDALTNTWIYTPTGDGRNLLAAELAPGGRLTEYHYDQFGQRDVMTVALTNVTRYGFDSIGRLISTTIYVGQPAYERTTLNRYDGAGNLISTTVNFNPDANADPRLYNLTTLYEYDGAGRQIAITDTIKRVTHNLYNDAGQLISTKANFTDTSDFDPNLYNLTTHYGYDAVGNRILVTDTRSLVTKTEFDNLNRPITVTTNYKNGEYDPRFPDEDIAHVTHYDPAGNVVEQIEMSASGALDRVTRTQYDTLNRPITVTRNYDNGAYSDAQPDLDLVTVTTYDAAGNAVKSLDPANHPAWFRYDELNRLISTTNALSGTTLTQYDAVGNRVLVTDVLTRATRYEYDKLNRLITTTFPYTGWVVNTYDPAGNLTRVTDALGHSTVYTYNLRGQLIAQTDAMSGTTRYEYDRIGNRVAITDAKDIVTHYEFDIAGHVLVMTQSYTTTLGLDPDTYNLVTRYRYDKAGNVISMTSPLTATTVYTYDTLSRVIAQSDGLGRTWDYQYDALGNRAVITDANRLVTRFEFDKANRLTAVFYPTDTIRYGYDAVGNRTVMTDAIGVTTFRYDALNRLTSHTDALSQTVGNVYYADGSIRELHYPDGKVVTYTYNANNWLTGVRDWSGRVITYTYDRVGRVITQELPNQIVTTYRYDDANRLTGLTTRNAGWTLGAYTYTLDALGQRIKAEEYVSDLSFVDYLPLITNNYSGTVEGQSALFGGDDSTFVSPLPLPEDTALGTLDSPLPTPVSVPGTSSLLSSPPQSSASSSVFPNALATTFLSPLSPPASCPGGLPAFGSTEIITYTYDPLSRLTDAFYSSGACFRYNYDAGNNVTWSEESITSTRVITYAYDITSRLQTSKIDIETITWYYRHDGNGNLVEMTPNGTNPANGAIRYTYNVANQLNKIETHNGSTYIALAQMAYDGIGSRVVLTGWVSGVAYTTTYASRIAGKVQILQAKSGVNATSYLYGLNQIGEFGSQTVYYLTDGVGSIRHLVDPNGAVKLARMYEPFGQVLVQTGVGDPIYGYLGAQFDRISGLLYINGRYYDPITGRFLSPSSGGSNPYVPLGGAALAPILILALIGRRKKGKIWTGWLLIALIMSAGLTIAGCNMPDPQNEDKTSTSTPQRPPNNDPSQQAATPVTTPSAATAAPPQAPLQSPTATCTPTQASAPVQSTTSSGILNSTVGLAIITYENGLPYTEYALATYLQTGQLLTHDHFIKKPSQATEVWIYSAAGGNPIAIVKGSDIQQERVVDDAYGLYRLTVNLGGKGVVGANSANHNNLQQNDQIVVPRWKENLGGGEVNPTQGIITIVSTVKNVDREGGGIPPFALVKTHTETGDSGGGLWWNGSVIGSLRSEGEEGTSWYSLYP
jgi:RHS repeat-associated protein